MDAPNVSYARQGRLGVIRLERPEALNALTLSMIAEVERLALAAEADPDVIALCVTGAGRGFCAGGDVSAMAGGGGAPKTFEAHVDRQRAGHELSRLLYEMPKVTIAAVNGAAAGAGLGVALSCDLVLASERARFATAFARVGFGGDFGTTWQLTRRVGPAKAKELFFLADVIGAEEALRLGLVNRVIAGDDFAGEVAKIATRIAHGPLVSYRYMKENVNLALTSDFRTLLDREAVTHLRCGQTADHREGVAAFLEKREPRFQGR